MKMQAKHIPTQDVLASVLSFGGEYSSIYVIWERDFSHYPFKVFKAKMDKLGKRGLVDCCCNECSSWIGLTTAGADVLEAQVQP